jgi:hypothetical protein
MAQVDMKFFPYVWARAGGDPIATPLGEACCACGIAIRTGDLGLLLPHIESAEVSEKPWHRECFIKSIFGSNNQLKMLTSDSDGNAVIDTLPWKKN